VIFRCRISHLDVLLLSPVVNNPGRLYSSSSQAKTYAFVSCSFSETAKEVLKEDGE